MQRVAASDPRLTWRGHIELESGDGWIRPWRLPLADKPFVHEALITSAGQASGVRLGLITTSRQLVLQTTGTSARGAMVSLVIDGRPTADVPIDDAGQASFALPGGSCRAEVWLPHMSEMRIAGVQIDADAAVAPAPVSGRRWITYGSSITHGSRSSGPLCSWPARVAVARGLDLLNLGYGGQCHLDPLIARCIAAQPANAISIKAGINIYNQASLGPRTFRANLMAFVRLVRDGHPTTPIAVMSAIFSCERETTENRVGLTLAAMRQEVAAAVAAMRAAGDTEIHYLDGLELLGPADVGRLPDKIHPDDEGYAMMARRFVDRLGPVLFTSTGA